MLKIRLQRVGRKHEPSFRVVLTDSKNSTKSGRYLEVLGAYDPRKTTEHFDGEKIKYWISKGAKPTPTMNNILINQKIIEGKKINVLPRKKPITKEIPAVEVSPSTKEVEPTAAKVEESVESSTPEVSSEEEPKEIKKEEGEIVADTSEEKA